MLPDYSFRKVLLTNGLLLTSQIIRQLNFDEVQISIDGIGRSHEMVRGEGSFRSAMDAINLCIESGIDLSVSTMIHRGNLADFDEMEQLFRGMGIKDWTVDVPCAAGRLRANRDLQLEPEEGGGYLRYGFGEGLHAGAAGFACGLHLMSVSAAGKASKCSFYSEAGVGTVEEGLRECWGRIVPLRLEELRCDCDHLEACRGGCRYRAEVLGDPLGKDLYRCALYDIIDQEKRRENFSERRCVE
jgi:radical SAM protein with 4Fe4S-binding SPASM domain